MRVINSHSIFILAVCIPILLSCGSKGGGSGLTNPCTGVTITISGNVTHTTGAGAMNGAIAVSASGSPVIVFSINGSGYQSSGHFTGLAAGTYTITGKSPAGCTGSSSFTVNDNDPCVGQTFTVGGSAINATPCLTTGNGSITVTTSGGGSGFTYNLNGGAFQVSPTFSNLAANAYTVGAKETGGCIKTATVTVNPTAPGTLFSAVKTIITANCAITACHSGPTPTGGLDFTQDCTIVTSAARIKLRAVDNFNTANQMPPLPTAGLSLADRNSITNWVNAGGLYTN